MCFPFSDVRIGAVHGKASSRSDSSSRGSGAPSGTFAHTISNSVAPPRGSTSVTIGPPPRIDVRLPAPPDGANAWNV